MALGGDTGAGSPAPRGPRAAGTPLPGAGTHRGRRTLPARLRAAPRPAARKRLARRGGRRGPREAVGPPRSASLRPGGAGPGGQPRWWWWSSWSRPGSARSTSPLPPPAPLKSRRLPEGSGGPQEPGLPGLGGSSRAPGSGGAPRSAPFTLWRQLRPRHYFCRERKKSGREN